MDKWQNRFINLAGNIATWSKDPSTKVGAVIVDDRNRVVSVGYNGFAHGVDDSEYRYTDRDLKYPLVIHAEANAILHANKQLDNCSIYVYPMPPCTRCASMIIQTGIKKVFSIEPTEDMLERWGKEIKLTQQIFKEASVELTYLKY